MCYHTTKKHPRKGSTNRGATDLCPAPVIKLTFSIIFKESGNGEELGTIAAYNAIRKHQAENVLAKTI